MDRPNRQPMAGSAALVRPLEQRIHALPRLGEGGYLETGLTPSPVHPDMEYAMVDATIVKVHRHGQGAKGGFQSQAIEVVRKVA